MKHKRKNNSGITLVALVIAIISLIILSAVSINAAIGDGGIIGKAKQSNEDSKIMAAQEQLESVMMMYNGSEFYGYDSGLEEYLSREVSKHSIDSYLTSTDNTVTLLERDGYYFEWIRDPKDKSKSSYIMKVVDSTVGKYIKETASKLTNEEQKTLVIVTAETINSEEKYVFHPGQVYVVVDENLDGRDFDFRIPSGDPVTIAVFFNMSIDNSDNTDRAAITLEVGSTLNLYIGESGIVQVHSGLGATAPVNHGDGAVGGHGGFAGINVPEGATLNILGKRDELTGSRGILIARGGDASDGGISVSLNAGGGGGGGGGAGIGGNGGNGGDSNELHYEDQHIGLGRSGTDGFAGQNCGTININNDVIVYAIGGAGGSGGTPNPVSKGSGAGGGGYPGAGIGGGGAGGGGGDHANGGGGFSAGVAEDLKPANWCVTNGAFWKKPTNNARWISGSCYYSNRNYDTAASGNGITPANIVIGGQGGWSPTGFRMNNKPYRGKNWTEKSIKDPATNKDGTGEASNAGDGGIGGKGGIVTVSQNAKVYAYNGNMITDDAWDYNTKVYEYDKDGVRLDGSSKDLPTKEIKPVEIVDKTIVPSVIYAQDGILRKVYKCATFWDLKGSGIFWGNDTDYPDQFAFKSAYEYYQNLFGDTLYDGEDEEGNPYGVRTYTVCPKGGINFATINGVLSERYDRSNLMIRDEIIEEYDASDPEKVYTLLTGYENPDNHSRQGVGSGAGYIELGNGTYTVSAELN